MKNAVKMSVYLAAWALLAAASAQYAVAADPAAGKDTILKGAELSAKIFPERVFFRGQVAPVQMRNSAAIHFSDDAYLLVGLVDNSGYSSGIREKYQAYLISEVALEVGSQKLPAGAYGVGIIAGGKFVVMDLGAHDLFQESASHDAEIKRPVPLQIVAGAASGSYRLYIGRDFVEIHRQ